MEVIATIFRKETRYGPQCVAVVKWAVTGAYRVVIDVSYPHIHTDWPIEYSDGSIVYDSPERIPAYIKRHAKKAFKYIHQVLGEKP